MTPNATVTAWTPDDSTGGAVDNDGRYVPGAGITNYITDKPCNAQGFVRDEVRDAVSGSVITEPCRLSLDVDRATFRLGDYVAVTYDDDAVEGRVGEIRKLARISRGTRRTIMWIQWLLADT